MGYVYLGADKDKQVNIAVQEVTIDDIDEMLGYLRLELQDYYGHRVSPARRESLLERIDDLLDARNELAKEGN